MSEYDVVVIGGGAAGLSAALVLSRARRRVAVVDSGRPRNAPAAHLHGFLSRDGAVPADLLAHGRSEVEHYGAVIVEATVSTVVPNGRAAYWVLTADGRRISTRRVLVTTGLRDELPDIPGLSERWARDVLHCPYCHGYEVRDQRLGVLGAGPDAVRYAQIVRQWSADLVYVTPAETLTNAERTELLARSIDVVEGEVTEVVVDADRLRGIRLGDGRIVALDALFVPPRFVPNDTLLADLGCAANDAGRVVVDGTGHTTVPGVWAAGNVVDPRAQLITAAGDGSAAAIALNADLVAEDVRISVRELAHGLTPVP